MRSHRRYYTCYGSLLINQSESFEFAELQIETLIGGSKCWVEDIQLIVDIVASPRQLRSGFAHEVGKTLLNFIDLHYPSLGARVIGITDNPRFRPGRDKVMQGSRRVNNTHQFILLGNDLDVYPQNSRE